MAIFLTNDNINQYLEESKRKPLIVDVYAEWCGPCKQMAPAFEELAKELATKYNFAKINVDEESDLASAYKVRSVPTILFIKDGKVVAIKIGAMTKEALKNEIEKVFK